MRRYPHREVRLAHLYERRDYDTRADGVDPRAALAQRTASAITLGSFRAWPTDMREASLSPDRTEA